ncbi:Na+/proline symporter/nitrogen-specific signal transduction histidine kinase [Halomonas campaniensis]|uniref:histidine kinase n=1 Tax=Halomonas campaniensis TaxID=213554 RepID=A0A7W5PAR0_9GAMM|nr:ATP-binding protein [Halomonas campaniensis]MBB3330862.1 Na+/proline symporter/nitrogen-specific signal transduction histidine kinase [Halomonas campaniensis]
MNASLAAVFALGTGFLLVLFLCALAVERGWIPTRITRHPLVYTLALGVYASAWAIYGSLELASTSGYGYLAYYLGVAGAFLLAPVLLVPIQRMTRTYQLASLSDLFAFRFRSRWVGTLITLISLLAVLPLLALQVQTLGNAIFLMTGAASPALLALAFCAMIALFAMLFGARQGRRNDRHDSLLAVIALSSLVKLVAMLGLGAIALFGIFDGPMALQAWLDGPGQVHQASVIQTDPAHWRTLLLLFFAAALLMPHIFHITFAETLSRHTLLQASWSLPLFLLLMAIPVPLILWAGQHLGAQEAMGTAYLAYGLSDALWVQALAFIAGLAAASATMVLIALALSGMILNHVLLVAHPPEAQPDLYRWLLWLRRMLIAAVILGGWLFYRIVGVHHDLTTLGLAAFVGMSQCLPGLLALLYWPGANRKGMVAGLAVGLLVWLLGLWGPLLTELPPLVIIPPGLEGLAGEPDWYVVTLVSLAANVLVLILVSLATRTSEGERAAAEACSVDAVIRPKRLPLEAATGEDFKRHLARALGEEVAIREVDRALDDLGLSPLDGRPYALRRLRDRLQANLSGLMGPSVARDIVDRYLPYRQGGPEATEDIHFVESRLEAYRSRLTGLARELDGLRRYHRRTLTRLPVGLCAFGDDGELLMWNDALAALTGIDGESVIGARRDSLPAPWGELLGQILAEPRDHLYKQPVTLEGGLRYLSLHKAELEGGDDELGGKVILIEDHSEMKWLEDELVHAARLASIGQLAAGVAHEIGNPITGISSLAQNLRYDTEDPEVLETAAQIQQLTDRVSRIVASLVGFAHGGRHVTGQAFGPVSMAAVTDEALHLIHLARSGEDVAFLNRCPDEPRVEGDAQRLLQVMVNLLGNARDASEPGGRVVIAGEPRDGGLRVTVTDEGHGIDPRVRDHLFEPFTTTKPPGEGTGLGLPLVYSIVAEHHGQIEIDSPPPGQARGTRISLWLPLNPQEGETPR